MKAKKLTAVVSAVAMISSLMVTVPVSAASWQNSTTEKTDSTTASVKLTYPGGSSETKYYNDMDDAADMVARGTADMEVTVYKDCNLSYNIRTPKSTGNKLTINAAADTNVTITATRTSGYAMLQFIYPNDVLSIGTEGGTITINDAVNVWGTFNSGFGDSTSTLVLGPKCVMKRVTKDEAEGTLYIGGGDVIVDGADISAVKKIASGFSTSNTRNAKIELKGDVKLNADGLTTTVHPQITLDYSQMTAPCVLESVSSDKTTKTIKAGKLCVDIGGKKTIFNDFWKALTWEDGSTRTITLYEDTNFTGASGVQLQGSITINAADGKNVTLTHNGGNFDVINLKSTATYLGLGISGGNLTLKDNQSWDTINSAAATKAEIVFGPKFKAEKFSENRLVYGNSKIVIDGADISNITTIGRNWGEVIPEMTIKGNAKLNSNGISFPTKSVTSLKLVGSDEYKYTSTVSGTNTVIKRVAQDWQPTMSRTDNTVVLDYSDTLNKDFIVIAAAYDNAGRLQNAVRCGSDGKCTLTVNSDTKEIKGFVWDASYMPKASAFEHAIAE